MDSAIAAISASGAAPNKESDVGQDVFSSAFALSTYYMDNNTTAALNLPDRDLAG